MAAGTGMRRRRLFPLIWLGSAVSAVLLVLGVNGSLSAFSASITNSNNTTNTGTLIMKESGPGSAGTGVVCTSTDSSTNASTCTMINKYGQGGVTKTLVPGGNDATTVLIQNTGSVNAGSFNISFGTCAQTVGTGASSAPGNLCNYLQVAVYAGTGTTGTPVVGPATPNALNTAGAVALTAPTATTAGAAGQNYTVQISFPSSTTPLSDNAFEGLSIIQPIVWTFNQ